MRVDADAGVHVGDLWVPFSDYASERAREQFLRYFAGSDWPPDVREPDAPADEELTAFILDMRERADRLRRTVAEKMIDEFAVSVTPEVVGGVQTDVVEPLAGVGARNRSRVLINLHGGGMIFGARWEGQVMSIPIAARAGMRVVTVDYRMAPEHRFPAASEDVAAVYEALLCEFEPESVGIYGCSAGGGLTGMALAWFQQHGLPRPGAAGFIGASVASGLGGDSLYVSRALSGQAPYRPGENPMQTRYWRALQLYESEADTSDPLLRPLVSPEVLSRFPPSLVLNSGRDVTLSAALHSHLALVKAGVEAELYVWDGLWHAFLYDSELPESQEAYDVIASFFDRRLR